jgi:cytochrome c-type biogenesis protein CcmF
MPWKRASVGKALRTLTPALILALAVGGLTWAMQTGNSLLAPVGLFLGAWLVSGAAVDLWLRTNRTPSRVLRLPRADWGRAVAHAGLGITMVGIAGLMAWQKEDIRVVQIGETWQVGGFDLRLDNVENVRGPNYLSVMGFLTLEKDGREIAQLRPEKRNYPVARMPTTEAAIDYRFLRDVYVVIGDPQENGGWAVRTYIKPLANWIWAGSALMALGGALSLSDRRYRVAAGARRQREAKAQAQGMPAE